MVLVFLETDSFNQPVLGLPAWHGGVVPARQDGIELDLQTLLKVVTHLAACLLKFIDHMHCCRQTSRRFGFTHQTNHGFYRVKQDSLARSSDL